MTILTPISNPTVGERIVGVSPTMAPNVSARARRRLNLFTGRALTHDALQVEQNSRSALMSTWAQRLAAGVLSGLEVDLESGFLHIAAGTGLLAGGEDVTIPRAMRVELNHIMTDASGVTDGPAEAKRLELLRLELDPLPGIVVLKPVVLERIPESAAADSPRPSGWHLEGTARALGDQCRHDPSAYAFEDWQLVDAVQVMIYLWPTSELPLPPMETETDRLLWRNQLAWGIFTAERNRPAGELLPWLKHGVPIGLIGFGENWEPLFVDRNSVVRRGGDEKPRTPLTAQTATPAQSHAQLSQFSEHVVELSAQDDWNQLRGAFRYLPAAGLLPRAAAILDLPPLTPADAPSPNANHFFPENYQVEFAPIPVEQLDAAMRQSLSLERLDLTVADQVRILVPVPQMVFEPDLLKRERISDEFQQRIDAYAAQRNEELRRRDVMRAIVSSLHRAAKGTPFIFKPDDASAVIGDEVPVAKLPEVTVGDVTIGEEDLLKQHHGVEGELDALNSIRLATLLAELKSGTAVKATGASVPLTIASELDRTMDNTSPLSKSSPDMVPPDRRGSNEVRPSALHQPPSWNDAEPHDTSPDVKADQPTRLRRPAWSNEPLRTSNAGLYFLVPVLARLGMQSFLVEEPTWIEWDLPQRILRRLAAELQIDDDDPILGPLPDEFAFSDFLPEFSPPAAWDLEVVRAETLGMVLSYWDQAIREWLLQFTELSLDELVRRPGLIAWTRTHIDLIFSHAQTDIRVRLAGLDLSPGWVPWLSRVVTFHYITI